MYYFLTMYEVIINKILHNQLHKLNTNTCGNMTMHYSYVYLFINAKILRDSNNGVGDWLHVNKCVNA